MRFFKRLPIQYKLVVGMGFSLLLFVIISAVLSITLTGMTLRDRVSETELPAIVTGIRNDLRTQIESSLASSLALANNQYLLDWEDSGLSDEGLAQWQKHAARVKSSTRSAAIFWVSHSSGRYFTEEGQKRQLSPSDPGDAWFYGFLNGGQRYTLDIDRNNETGTYMMFINTRFRTDGGKLGVAGLGLSVDDLIERIRNYRIGDSGYVYLVRKDGRILVHRDPALVDGKHYFKDLPGQGDLASLFKEKNYSHGSFHGPNGERMIATSYMPDLGAYIVAELDENEVVSRLKRSVAIVSLVTVAVGSVIALIFVTLIGRAIAAPIRRASRLLREIAEGEGDLSRRLAVETGDELGELADSFNRFVATLQDMVGQVKATAQQLGVTVDTMNRSAQGSRQDVSKQMESTHFLSDAIREMSSTIDDIALAASKAANAVSEATQRTEEGQAVVATTVVAIQQLADEIGRAEEVVQSLARQSEVIENVIGVIRTISEQTNLLALNAAIEAARAGEQGRGFAVVADEVRKLAQNTNTATVEIDSVIRQLQGDVQNVVAVMKRGESHVQTGVDSAQGAGLALSRIHAVVSSINDVSFSLASATSEQTAVAKQIGHNVDEIDRLASQTSRSAEENVQTADTLEQHKQQLDTLMNRFKI